MWRVIGGDDICSESSVRVRSALGAGKGRNYVLLVCVDLNLVLKLDNITLKRSYKQEYGEGVAMAPLPKLFVVR